MFAYKALEGLGELGGPNSEPDGLDEFAIGHLGADSSAVGGPPVPMIVSVANADGGGSLLGVGSVMKGDGDS